jgi:photosystem II stability/assembly factor-like uncharacterized protein
MKHTITLFLWLLLLATTFEGEGTKGWQHINFPMQNVLTTDICFLDSLQGWAVANDNDPTDTVYIFKTTDGGNSWSVQYSDSLRVLNTIQFVNQGTGYAGGGFGDAAIIKTTNSGDTWIKTNPGPFYSVSDLYFVSPDTGWICSDEQLDGGIFRTTNGGASWQSQAAPLLGYQHLDFLNKDTGWCLLKDGKVFKTTNSGSNWIQLSTVVFSGLKTGIQFINDATGWVISGQSFQGIFKTVNGGATWFIVNDPDILADIPFDIDLLSSKRGWIAKRFGMLALVNDSLLGIQTISQSPLPNLRAIDMVDTAIGYAAGGVMLKTKDGGGPITGIGNNVSTEIGTYSLIGNYPNPFNSQTVIRYKLKESGYVAMEIFDIAGRIVSQPVSSFMHSGNHEVAFDASALSSGVYVCFLKVSDKAGSQAFAGSVKMILSK